MSWQKKVIFVEEAPRTDYVAFIDETGTASFNDLSPFFSVSAVLLTNQELERLLNLFLEIKLKYWNNGLHGNQRVVFHSHDISKKRGAFSLNLYDNFCQDLADAITTLEFKIFSATINKENYKLMYPNPRECYLTCCSFILERICKYFIPDKTLTLLLEARGKREDRNIHNQLMNIYRYGTYFVQPNYFQIIKGIYFANKRTKSGLKSYPGLELADLCASDLQKYVVTGHKTQSFYLIESKIYGFPKNGYGFKLFP